MGVSVVIIRAHMSFAVLLLILMSSLMFPGSDTFCGSLLPERGVHGPVNPHSRSSKPHTLFGESEVDIPPTGTRTATTSCASEGPLNSNPNPKPGVGLQKSSMQGF